MSQENETAASLGVRAEIDMRLAAIAPKDFVIPILEFDETTMRVVCTATDEIKRLKTLRHIIADELAALFTKGNEIAKASIRVITNGESENSTGAHKAIDKILQSSEGIPEETEKHMNDTIQKLQGIEIEIEELNRLGKIVKGIFWLEIRRQHVDLAKSEAVCLTTDWSLCTKKSDRKNEIESLLKSVREAIETLPPIRISATRSRVRGQ